MYDYAELKQAKKNYTDNRPKGGKATKTGPDQIKSNDYSDTIKPLEAKIDFSQISQPVQRRAVGAPGALDRSSAVSAGAENKTGLPDRLKTGIESLSGMDISDVRVHRNSPEPERIGAFAYTKGADIHLGPGQDRHLPHEAWHVVQQKQGRVQPTVQMKGKVNINDDAGLEKEADVMGDQSMRAFTGRRNIPETAQPQHAAASNAPAVQRAENSPANHHGRSYNHSSVIQCALWSNAQGAPRELEDILADSAFASEFYEYSKTEFCDENLDFINACRIVYPALGRPFFNNVGFDENTLFTTFVSSASPRQVNISSQTLKKISEDHHAQNYDAQNYEEAYLQIVRLTQSDLLPRFLKSKPYKDMVAYGRLGPVRRYFKRRSNPTANWPSNQ